MNEELAASLKKAKSLTPTSALHFVLIMKGGRDGALLMDKTRITPKAINEAKNACGGSNVIAGRCFGGEEGVVFETTEPPPDTMQVCLDVIIKRETKLTIKSVPRLGVGTPEDAAENKASPVENDSGPPDLTAEKQVAGRLKALLPKIQNAVKAGNQEVKERQVQILRLLQNKDYGAALGEVVDLEKALLATGPGAAPPSPEAIMDFQVKLQAFKPLFAEALKQAKQTDPGWAENLDSNYAQMVQEVKAGNLEAASKTLDSLSRMTESSAAAQDEINFRQSESAMSAVSPSEWKQFTDRFGNLEKLFVGGPIDQKELQTCLTGIQQLADRLGLQLGASEPFQKFVEEWGSSLEYLYRFMRDTDMENANRERLLERLLDTCKLLEESDKSLRQQQRGDLSSEALLEDSRRIRACLQMLGEIYRQVEREIKADVSGRFREIQITSSQFQTLDPTFESKLFEEVTDANELWTRLFEMATADPKVAVQKVKHLVGLCKEVEREL